MRRVKVVWVWAAALVVLAVVVLWASAGPEVVDPETHRPTSRGVVRPRAGSRLAPPRPLPARAPWMFGGGPRHGGRSAFRGPEEPRQRWAFATRGPVRAQPVFGHDGTLFVGSLDGCLYALGAAGALRFNVDTGGPIYGAAAVAADGTVYVGSDADRLYAISARGTVRWIVETERDADTSIALGPGGELYLGSGPDLLAVAPSGRVLWRFRARDKVFSAPAVGDDGVVYFGSQDDHVYAVNADGSMRWSYRTGGDVDSAPTIGDDGTVYVGSDDGRVHALHPDGKLAWSTSVGGAVRAGVALGAAPGAEADPSVSAPVLAATFGPRPRLVALDSANGVQRWTFELGPVGSQEIGLGSSPAVDAAGRVFFGAHDDHLYAVSPSGVLRWVFRTSADVDSAPSLGSDGTLYFGSDDHHVYALR